MPFNYFCCRKHDPPIKFSTPQPIIPGVLASPKCPSCGRTMEHYDSGIMPTDMRPAPPPLRDLPLTPAIPNLEVAIYSGSGTNPGHGQVTWEITRNAARLDMTIKVMLGIKTGGNWSSVQEFKLTDGLLNLAQPGAKQDWWLNAPLSAGGDKALWHSFKLDTLVPPNRLGTLPPTLGIGVKLGNAAFGLIHLLAGHASSVRNVGPYTVASSGDPRDDVYRTMLSLQSGMQRFKAESIREIYHDPVKDKLLIKGSDAGLIVVTRTPGDPRYAITTVFNTQSPLFGNKIYG